jgi:hypothetical protein
MKKERILEQLKDLKNKLPEDTTVDDLIEKAAERENMTGMSSRKQIGVHMEIDLWWRFKERAAKERAAKERCSAGQLLEKLVREYLEKEERESN